MKWRALLLLAPFVVMTGCDAATPTEPAANVDAQFSAAGGRHGALGVVYVSSQGLYFDTFVSAQRLPNRGRFQKLDNGVTEFGPGDRDFVGGRWWIDTNGNGVREDSDTFLLCPLLGPGRTSP